VLTTRIVLRERLGWYETTNHVAAWQPWALRTRVYCTSQDTRMRKAAISLGARPVIGHGVLYAARYFPLNIPVTDCLAHLLRAIYSGSAVDIATDFCF